MEGVKYYLTQLKFDRYAWRLVIRLVTRVSAQLLHKFECNVVSIDRTF